MDIEIEIEKQIKKFPKSWNEETRAAAAASLRKTLIAKQNKENRLQAHERQIKRTIANNEYNDAVINVSELLNAALRDSSNKYEIRIYSELLKRAAAVFKLIKREKGGEDFSD